jgi:sugar lactone lactonase YvrE
MRGVRVLGVLTSTVLAALGATTAGAQVPQCADTSATIQEDSQLQSTITCAEEGYLRHLAQDHVRSVAGSGLAGATGDGGPATAATLNLPNGVFVDRSGNLYVADSGNHLIRRVDVTTGNITTIAGLGVPGFSGDGGLATQAELNDPRRVIADAAGNVFVADIGNARVRRIDAATGVITTVAGGGSGGSADGIAATDADFIAITGIAFDPAGDLFVVEVGRARIRRVASGSDGLIAGGADERVFTIAGTGVPGFSGDGGPALDAQFSLEDVAFDSQGNLYIADRLNHRVRRVTPGADGLIRGADDEIVTTIAGGGAINGDGILATGASLNLPRGVAVDRFGNVFICEAGAVRVRRVDATTGVISTVAGGGSTLGEDILAATARVFNPRGLATDAEGNLFISELGAHRIRAVRLAPVAWTYQIIDSPSHGLASMTAAGALSYTPAPDFAGEDMVRFVAVNAAGQPGAPATITITITPLNDAPRAEAGPDQDVETALIVQLDGHASSDPEGEPITFAWRLLVRPIGSSAGLVSPDSPATTFVPDLSGTYVIELTVTDPGGSTDTDSVSVVATATATRVIIAAVDANAAESGEPGTFRITRTGSLALPLDVAFQRGGTAKAEDVAAPHGLPASPVTIPAGQATIDLVVQPVDDLLVEGAETVILQLVDRTTYDLGTLTLATMTIADNDVAPVVTIAVSTANAGEGMGFGSFRIFRTGDTSKPLDVAFQRSGTASAADVTSLPVSPVTIVAGWESALVFVTPLNDALIEGPETVTLQLLDRPQYDLGAEATATLTIADNDVTPVVSVTTVDSGASEPSGAAFFRISRDAAGDLAYPLEVHFKRSGSASAADFSEDGLPVSPVIIPADRTSILLPMVVVNDALVEGPETVTLELIDRATYDLGAPTTATHTITDNDTMPIVNLIVVDPAAAEPNNSGRFRLTRTGDLAYPLTVYFQRSGSATEADVASNSLPVSPVTMPAGEWSLDLPVTIANDSLVEGSETITLQLIDRPSYDLGPQTGGTVTIADNDSRPVLSITAYDTTGPLSEPGTSGGGEFAIARSGDTAFPLTFSFQRTGTASANDVAAPPNGLPVSPMTFPAGVQVLFLRVRAVDDPLIEGPETITLTLLDRPSYDLAPQPTATLTIRDNDVMPEVTIIAFPTEGDNVAEPNIGGAFFITRTGNLAYPLTVYFQRSGTATESDLFPPPYGMPVSPVTIPAGESYVYLWVRPVDDHKVEGTETITLQLIDRTTYDLGSPSSATITILDNDTSP